MAIKNHPKRWEFLRLHRCFFSWRALLSTLTWAASEIVVCSRNRNHRPFFSFVLLELNIYEYFGMKAVGVADWSQRGSDKNILDGWILLSQRSHCKLISPGMVVDTCLLNSTWAKEIWKELSFDTWSKCSHRHHSWIICLSWLKHTSDIYCIDYLRPLTTNNHTTVYMHTYTCIYIYITQKKNNIKQLLYKPINTPSSSTHCSTSCHQVFQTTVSASSSAGPFDKRAQSSGEHLRRGGLDKNLGDLHLRSDQNPPNHSFWLVNRDPYIVLL